MVLQESQQYILRQGIFDTNRTKLRHANQCASDKFRWVAAFFTSRSRLFPLWIPILHNHTTFSRGVGWWTARWLFRDWLTEESSARCWKIKLCCHACKWVKERSSARNRVQDLAFARVTCLVYLHFRSASSKPHPSNSSQNIPTTNLTNTWHQLDC